MQEEFIDEKGLEFVAGKETDDFWGGVDECGSQRFELYIQAGEEGPSPVQVSRYEAFVERIDDICFELQNKFSYLLKTLDNSTAEKFAKAKVLIDIVLVRKENTGDDIELSCRAVVRRFIFRKRMLIGAGITNNHVTALDRI